MSATRSSSTRTSPISAAFPQTTFSQPGGSPASVLELREQQRRERRLRRGLQHDRAARGEGRRDLVGDEVEGEVERRDGSDDSDRNPERERDLPGAGGRRVHRDDVSGELPGLDRRHRERGGRARRLDAGGLDRLPCLGRDRPRDLVRALVHEPSRPLEDRGPLVGRKRLRQRSLGGVDGAPRDARVALRDAARARAVVGRAHVDPVARLDPLATDEELPLGRGRRHPRKCNPSSRAARHALREVRRGQHRVPGRRRGAARPRVRLRLGLESRPHVAGAVVRTLPPQARVVLAADPLRQAGYGPVRPRAGGRPAHARGSAWTTSAPSWTPRRRAGGAARPLRGWPDVPPLRGHVSGAHRRARADRDLRAASRRARLSVRRRARGIRRLPSRRSRDGWGGAVGLEARAPSLVDDDAVPDLVVGLPAHEREPGCGTGAHADERGDRRAPGARDDRRPDPRRAPHRRPIASRRGRSLPRGADPWREARRASRRSTTFRSSETRTRSSTRSRSS